MVVDAPVSGGGGAASEGRLLVMVGGDAAVVEQCRPVFEAYADPVVHLGELGCGQTTKLLNNLLFTANLGTAATALSLANALGISPNRLTEVVSHSSGNSFALNAITGTGGCISLPDTRGRYCRRTPGLSSIWLSRCRHRRVRCLMRPTLRCL